MITKSQKETLSTLKNTYKKINSRNMGDGVIIDVGSIINKNEEGKKLITELKLSGEAMKDAGKDILNSFKRDVEADFNMLGITISEPNIDGKCYFTSSKIGYNLGYFSVSVQNKILEINGKNYHKFLGYSYVFEFTKTNVWQSSSVGFLDLLSRDCIKLSLGNCYDFINR